MVPRLPSRDSPIIIVGAGVFGLSSAIHLARRGFSDISVFDRQPYHQTQYDFDKGCDAASADCNKVIRAAYGDETWYQNLTLEAIEEWESWNASLEAGRDLPPGMMKGDRIYINCGSYHLGDDDDSSPLNPFEQRSVENLTKAGKGHTQYILSDPKDVARAKSDGLGHMIDPFNLSKTANAVTNPGYLDMVGGFVYADKACRYALHLAQRLGVKCILDRQAGSFVSFLDSSNQGKVAGIITADGTSHPAALTVIACGGWTPTLVPEIDVLCETTAGSIAMLQIPEHLRQRFSPEKFPVWHYKVRAGPEGNLYGFPVDERGVVKLGYRGTKYTNPQLRPGNRVQSVPITKWTAPSITGLPEKSLEVIRKFLDSYLPELAANGVKISQTRLCWYTDSFDNQFVVDGPPGKKGLLIATGGSGHAFKFLPVLGKYVADWADGVDSDMLRRWQWRSLKEGEKPHNLLGRGFENVHALQKVLLYEPGRGAKL